MKVLVFDEQKDVKINKVSVENLVKEVLATEGCLTNEVSIYFVSTEVICRLHKRFFNDSSPTDCITFPLDGAAVSDYHILGEVFVCPKTALDYVHINEYNKSRLAAELTLYITHGLLHLLGYDDVETELEKKMREAEKTHIERLTHKKLLLKL